MTDTTVVGGEGGNSEGAPAGTEHHFFMDFTRQGAKRYAPEQAQAVALADLALQGDGTSATAIPSHSHPLVNRAVSTLAQYAHSAKAANGVFEKLRDNPEMTVENMRYAMHDAEREWRMTYQGDYGRLKGACDEAENAIRDAARPAAPTDGGFLQVARNDLAAAVKAKDTARIAEIANWDTDHAHVALSEWTRLALTDAGVSAREVDAMQARIIDAQIARQHTLAQELAAVQAVRVRAQYLYMAGDEVDAQMRMLALSRPQ